MQLMLLTYRYGDLTIIVYRIRCRQAFIAQRQLGLSGPIFAAVEFMSTVVCWNCGRDLADIPRPISRHSNCPECFTDLHCCRLCKHFLPERIGVCAEDRADPPVEKENANFCSFFLPANSAHDQQSKIRGDSAKNALADLFGAAAEDSAADGTKQKSEQSATDTATDALNALFKPKK
jgi:hypothetical protein